MGSGFRLISAGENPTAANLNNYLSKQVVMTFSTTTARDAAVTSPEEGMVAVITGSDLMTVYTGSAWVEYGRYGAWESFTPTWSNLTVGNGTVTAKYLRIGSMVTYTGVITIGSTTTISGFVAIDLPVNCANPNTPGSARFSDSGTRNYVGTANINGVGTALGFVHSESGGFGSWNASNPFTPAAGDFVAWNITYEAA